MENQEKSPQQLKREEIQKRQSTGKIMVMMAGALMLMNAMDNQVLIPYFVVLAAFLLSYAFKKAERYFVAIEVAAGLVEGVFAFILAKTLFTRAAFILLPLAMLAFGYTYFKSSKELKTEK